ncbi:SDR family oxidoreductase [Acidocella sp. KAb 2-4]|uniref:SDR family oxidoreductase n=1 Tax=Acidocella sp. KAb 2-4 TaxID=2885158 RepID=UPI001D09469E|nr:SDR family oxidoreductase [Acidocella sp. KAb 2-4]MCB5945199.1 SDR family oxidoreductase [Acidocella sp. KAb 2-4]
MLLRDKVVVISGVGPGLGQALANLAAAEGARVVLAARNKDYLNKLVAEITGKGGQAIAVPCDVSNAAQCQALAEASAQAFGGRIHGLVNSAYLHGQWSFVANADPQDWANVFDVNCLGALRLTQACIPFLKGGGAVVNISTMATVRPYGGAYGMEMGYAAAKGGLNVLSKYMAADLGQYGIRVNTCRMGWIHGAPVENYIDIEVIKGRSRADIIAEITHDIPLKVIPPQDDCARAVLMLLSDYAGVVSGATLDINGGQWMSP